MEVVSILRWSAKYAISLCQTRLETPQIFTINWKGTLPETTLLKQTSNLKMMCWWCHACATMIHNKGPDADNRGWADAVLKFIKHKTHKAYGKVRQARVTLEKQFTTARQHTNPKSKETGKVQERRLKHTQEVNSEKKTGSSMTGSIKYIW